MDQKTLLITGSSTEFGHATAVEYDHYGTCQLSSLLRHNSSPGAAQRVRIGPDQTSTEDSGPATRSSSLASGHRP